jgi:DeoR family fructose operon transcriptional repressor
MFAHERHEAICDLLCKSRRLTIGQLEKALSVSPATLRRDLSELEASGKVIRVRGAVVHPSYFRVEPTLAQKSRASASAKREIASGAAAMIPTGAGVLLDAGTTCLALGRLLLPRADLTIWTHSLPLVWLAQESGAAANVVCIGGQVRAVSGALVGAMAMSWLQNLRADWCFVGASGLSEEGAFTTEMTEAAMKAEFLRRAKKRVLLADNRKWNSPASVRFGAWNDFDLWLTDTQPSRVLEGKKPGVRTISVREMQR